MEERGCVQNRGFDASSFSYVRMDVEWDIDFYSYIYKTIKRKMNSFICYLLLKMRSVKRMFGALSIIAKVLFVLVALLIGYGLIKAKFSYHDTSLGWIEVVFVFMGIRICHMTRQEKLLLDGLHVPLALVFLFRCWILSLPFFLLDKWAGLLSATIGTVVVVYLSVYRMRHTTGGSSSLSRNLRFRGSIAAAYQWIARYRTDVIWIIFIGWIMHLVALINDNPNMVYVAMGIMVFVPCFLVYYKQQDPMSFLRIYKSASYLMKRKTIELFVCSIVPLCWCLPVSCAVFPDETKSFIALSVAFLYANMLFMYSSYAFYPYIFMSFISAWVILVLSVVLLSIVPLFFAIGLLFVVLMIFHYIAISNIYQLNK